MTRTIARLDIKNEFVIKGVHLEGLRKVGSPAELANSYYEAGADELLFMDAVASLYDRNNLFDIIEKASRDVFIPICLGGGIRSLNDISKALHSGADKVAINTAAVHDLTIIERASETFGSQCIVGSIEAKETDSGWLAYFDNGREDTGIDVIDWAKKLAESGCGEIIVTSIDKEGTRSGFDIKLASEINNAVNCPITISGGYGQANHLRSLLEKVDVSAIAIASCLHYKTDTINNIKSVVSEINLTQP